MMEVLTMSLIKKITALLLALMLVMTVMPLAFARNEGEQRANANPSVGKEINEVRAQIKEKAQELRTEIKDLKEQYQAKKKEYQDNKEKVAELQKETKNCKKAEECDQSKADLRSGVKDYLLKNIAVIDASIQQVKERIEKSPVLTTEQKTEALAALASSLTELKTKEESLLAMQNVSAKDLKEAIKDLKKSWSEIKKTEQWLLAQLINSKMNNLVEKYGTYSVALEAKISELQAKSVDVTELSALKEKFDVSLEKLKTDQANLDQVWLDFKASTDKEAAIKTVREAQKQLKEDFNVGKEILKEFMSKYKELNRTERVDDSTDENETAVA